MMKKMIIAHAEPGGRTTAVQDSNGRVIGERRTTSTGSVTTSLESMSPRQRQAALRRYMRQNGVQGF